MEIAREFQTGRPPFAIEVDRKPLEAAHERQIQVGQHDCQFDQICSRQRQDAAQGRTLRILRNNDPSGLCSRLSHELAVLRQPLLFRAHQNGKTFQSEPYEECVMKCANHNCNRGIGLISYRRGWFGKRLYCCRECRDTFVTAPPEGSHRERGDTTYFEWLFLQPIDAAKPKPVPALVRVRAR